MNLHTILLPAIGCAILASCASGPVASNPAQTLTSSHAGIPPTAHRWRYKVPARACELHGRKWLAKGTPRAVVIAYHGISGHSDNYRKVGEIMSAQGISLYVPDRWSSGLNRYLPNGQVSEVGDIGKKEDWLADAEAALIQALADEERAGHGGGIRAGRIPVVVYANSWGAKLAPALLDPSRRTSPAARAAIREVDGLYLSTPGLWTKKDGTSGFQVIAGAIVPGRKKHLDVTTPHCPPAKRDELSLQDYTFRFLGKAVALTSDSRAALTRLGRAGGNLPFFLMLADDQIEHLMNNEKTLRELEKAGLIEVAPRKRWDRAEGACHFLEQEHPQTVADHVLAFIHGVKSRRPPSG